MLHKLDFFAKLCVSQLILLLIAPKNVFENPLTRSFNIYNGAKPKKKTFITVHIFFQEKVMLHLI